MASASEHLLHLRVGRVFFMNATWRIRRIYNPQPEILDAFAISLHELAIVAKAPGLSSVVVWDENGQQQTYEVSSDINIDDLRTSMQRALPNDGIVVQAAEGRVLLSGTVATQAQSDTAAKLASLFSKDVVNSLVVNPSRNLQVKLKVRIVEVDRSKLNQFGINLFNPGGGNTLLSGSTSQFPSTATLSAGSSGTGASVGGNTLSVSDPLNFLFYSAKADFGFTVRDLENKQILQILAEPTITTVSGQKASFISGGEFPFPVIQGSSGGLTSITIQFRPYGVKLDFTPEVNVYGTISLRVAPEVSALDYTNAVTISGYTIPALSTRHAETQVILRSGQASPSPACSTVEPPTHSPRPRASPASPSSVRSSSPRASISPPPS